MLSSPVGSRCAKSTSEPAAGSLSSIPSIEDERVIRLGAAHAHFREAAGRPGFADATPGRPRSESVVNGEPRADDGRAIEHVQRHGRAIDCEPVCARR